MLKRSDVALSILTKEMAFEDKMLLRNSLILESQELMPSETLMAVVKRSQRST